MKMTRILKGAGIRSSYGSMGAGAVTLIEDEKRILVDVGHFGNREVLVSRMKELGIRLSDIDIVVLTHINWDHCLNLDLFEDSAIILGAREYENGTLTGVRDGLTQMLKEYLSSMKYQLAEDGLVISKSTSILATPGHTPGHISVAVRDDGRLIVISGDAIPNLRSYRRGIPDFVFYSLDDAKRSIAKIKAMKPSIIIPGHDPPFGDNGYLETDTIDIILRNENEENTVLTLHKSSAEKPVIINE